MVKSGVVAALAGFVYGGLPAARQARQRYIQISQAEIYTSRVDAVVGQNLCVDADVGKEKNAAASLWFMCLFFGNSAQHITQPSGVSSDMGGDGAGELLHSSLCSSELNIRTNMMLDCGGGLLTLFYGDMFSFF